jgi:exodeoxyribonuclease VIII
MIDLETVSVKDNAAIISIGAVEFDIEEQRLLEEYYQNVELSSCLRLGLNREQGSIDWWAKDENKAARNELTRDAIHIRDALIKFTNWCGDENNVAPWSNGATFDLVIMKQAYIACSMRHPWKHFNESCYRTFKRMYPKVTRPTQTMKHHALEDAKYQARHLMTILNAITMKEETTTR